MATFDNGSVSDIQVRGRELVRALQVSLRTSRTHGWSNEASNQAVSVLVSAINTLVSARGNVGLHVASDFVFLDDVRLRVDASGYGFFEHLIHELTSRGVGSIFIGEMVTHEQVIHFLDRMLAVSEESAATEPLEVILSLNESLERHGAPISVGPVRDGEVDANRETEDVDRRERAKKAFFKAVTVARALLTSAHLNRRLDLRHAKRVVQNMVDLMMDEEFSLMGLTTLKDYDNYTFYHSVNVCIYSLALGKRAGLNRAQLSELGVAAMLHDMGKTRIPVDLLRKQGAFSPEEMDVMKRHPELGVRELVRMRGLSSLAFKSMVASFEHHLNYREDLPGYPRLRRPFKPHVIGRIVAIADCFDAMTTKRCYTPKAVTRDKALLFMLNQGGSKFDPVLVKLFANLVGVFPVGTLVRLRSGRMGVVTAASEDPSLCHRPRVRPVTNEAGIEGDYPEIDLAEDGPGGEPPDEILVAVDDETVGIDIGKYFV